MAIQQINISKSANGIALYGIPDSDGFDYLLTQNIDTTVAIPSGVNYVVFSYSAGATVKCALSTLSPALTLASNNSGLATTGRYNKTSMPVYQFDNSGNQQYLHLISPNVGDRVIITWYNNAA